MNHTANGWQRFMCWISDHYFSDAKEEGWFDALLLRAGDHPRAIRTMEYADHWEGTWGPRLSEPYPPFEEWRANADAFVENANTCYQEGGYYFDGNNEVNWDNRAHDGGNWGNFDIDPGSDWVGLTDDRGFVQHAACNGGANDYTLFSGRYEGG